MRNKLILLLYSLAVTSARAETLQIDPAHSVISFKVRHIFGTVNGRFRQFSGTLELDREHPEQSRVNATIQMRSIDTGIGKRDEHLLSSDFFDAAKFPVMTFKSSKVERTDNEKGDVTGEFTMHGVTHTLPLHVTLLPSENATTRWRISTEPLKRNDYGLRWSPSVETTSMIGQEISVTMEIQTSR